MSFQSFGFIEPINQAIVKKQLFNPNAYPTKGDSTYSKP